METLLIALIAIVAGAGITFFLTSKIAKPGAPNNSAEITLLQNQIAQSQALSQQQMAQFQSQMTQLQTSMTQNLNQAMELVGKQLSDSSQMVNKQLADTSQIVAQQLADNAQLIQQGQATIGARLDNAARVVGDVKREMGEIKKSGDHFVEVAKDISSLQQLLKAPKFRGGFGEVLLENLLREILPPGSYGLQYAFQSREIVDAVIHVSDKIVPIDSKFPLENFQKYVAAVEDAEKRTHYLQFARDVKKHIDAIARKYILPDEGTFEFAMVYIPAENIYYHVIAGPENIEETGSLHAYAISKRVMPVSPSSFYGYLQVILMGLRGLRIEEQAAEVMARLGQLNGDFSRFQDVFETLGRHIRNASASHDDAGRRLEKFGSKLQAVEQHDEPLLIPAAGEMVS